MGSFCLLTWFEDLQQEWSFCFKADSRFSPFLQVKLSYRLHRGNISSKVFVENSSFISKQCPYSLASVSRSSAAFGLSCSFPCVMWTRGSTWPCFYLCPSRHLDFWLQSAAAPTHPFAYAGIFNQLVWVAHGDRYWPPLLTNCSGQDLGWQWGLCAVLLEPVVWNVDPTAISSNRKHFKWVLK